jgi:hypothetical protein
MQVDYIDLNWNFKDVVNNIEVIRTKTRGIIASFSSFEIKKQIKFKKQLRDKIYSFNFETWKKDRILECVYNYFDIKELKKMCD